MARLEGWSLAEAHGRCLEVDRIREVFARYFFGDAAIQPALYDLVVNTGRVPLEDVTDIVAQIVRAESSQPVVAPNAGKGDSPHLPERPEGCFAQMGTVPFSGRRVLTLSRELGAGDAHLVPALADRLKLQVYDRELLEQEAAGLGVPATELEKIDEQPASIFQRFHPGSIYQRYFAALEQIMRELADRGGVILVGRGGNCFLRDDPRAFHVRFIATMLVRLRRVMEDQRIGEGVARKLVEKSDAQRRSFYESYFGVEWSNPLEYHVTVNSGRLGTTALDLVALAAARRWSRTE
jgi:cytidylate kinase